MIASLFDHLHLGDKVVCCLILQAIAEERKATIKVRGSEVVGDIVQGLGLDGLDWEDGHTRLNRTLCIAEFFDFLADARIPFFTSPSLSVDFDPPKLSGVPVCPIRRGSEDISFFQFDSRSQNDNKKRLSRKESMYFLKSKARFRAVGIGGTDTKKELPYEYQLGNLRWIINRMKSASQFVGVDSGMSHIAGALGVPSEIYLMHKKEQDVRMVERFYGKFYPNTRCTHDFSHQRRRLPIIKII